MSTKDNERETSDRELALIRSQVATASGILTVHRETMRALLARLDRAERERAAAREQGRAEALTEAEAHCQKYMEEDAPCDCRSNWNRAIGACVRAIRALTTKTGGSSD